MNKKEKFILGSLTVLGFTVLPFQSLANSNTTLACENSFQKLELAGEFKWEKSETTFRVEVGLIKNLGRIALIRNRGNCIAVCPVQSVKPKEGIEPLRLEMRCEGTSLSPLAVKTSLRLYEDQPEIRFGDWVGGYEKASLSLSRDQISPVAIQAKTESEIATALQN